MKATGFNHVSVHARDLEESTRFYTEIFGMEEIPAPKFPFAVKWLRLGDLQLHLFESDDPAPRAHHFGMDVDAFEAVYQRANELGLREDEGFFSKIYELPDGAVQMYIRDPAGNLVEIDWPDITTLDRSVVTDIEQQPEPQTGDALRATLYLKRREEQAATGS
jgi:catechol 2,3-dioxygenase-like lactoylglutathione lyase family enzyme